MNRVFICVTVVLLGCVFAFAQANQAPAAGGATQQTAPLGPPQPAHDFGFAQRHPRYTIRSGDVFEVMFEFTPDFNQTVTVQPDGYVSLRNIGDVYVAGQTIPDLTNSLRNSYSKILNAPMVSVVLKDFEKPYFIADGQVGHPGKYDLRGDTTVVQAVAMAGGFLPSAKHSTVVLFRRVSDDLVQSKLIDVKKMQRDHNLSEDVHLQPGDMVFVPKNRLSKIQPFIPTSSFNMVPYRF